MQSLNKNQQSSFVNNSTNVATPILSNNQSNKRQCHPHTSLTGPQTIANVAKPIFQIIYSFLSFNDQSLASLTNRKFNLAFIDAHEKFDWQEHPTYDLLIDYSTWLNKKNKTKIQPYEVLVNKLQHIRNLVLHDISVLALALYMNGPLPNLNSIKISHKENRSNLNFLAIVVNRIILESMKNPFENLPHLFELISQKCPKLEHLCLLEDKIDTSSLNAGFNRDMSCIFEKCSELKSFSCQLETFQGLETLSRVTQDYIPLTELNMSNLSTSKHWDIRAEIAEYDDIENEENFSIVLKKAPNLQKIMLKKFGIEVLFQYGNSNLKSISFYDLQSIPLECFTKKFNNLTTLQFNNFYNTFIKKCDGSGGLECVSNDNWFKYCPNLTDLDLLLDNNISNLTFPNGLSEEQQKCFPYNEEYIGKMLSYFPQLIRLRLPSSTGDLSKGFKILNQDFILSKLADHNKNLEELELATGIIFDRNYTIEGLIALSRGCPKIKSMNLSSLVWIDLSSIAP